MDSSLWTFLLNSPERSVPYPWERCFDLVTEILFYRNMINGSIIIDLRPRVNLGGGLYNVNTLWQELTAAGRNHFNGNLLQLQSAPSLFRRTINEYDQDTPILLCSTCCTAQLVYLLVPQLITHCPLCGRFMHFFG